jgi:hypothetical protein
MSTKLMFTHFLPLISQVHVAFAEQTVPVTQDSPLEKLAADTASVFSSRSNNTVVDGDKSGGSGGDDSGRGGSGRLGRLVASSTHALYVFVCLVCVVVLVQLLRWMRLGLMAVWWTL